MILRVRIKGGRFRDSRPSDLPNGNHDKNKSISQTEYITLLKLMHMI